MTAETKMIVPFVDMQAQHRALEPALSKTVVAVIERGDFILGGEVMNFEQAFAAYCGTAFAVGVDSGCSALELSLRAIGVGPGDEVITSANTFIATVGAISATGARPVLCDCDETGCPSVEATKGALSRRTRAIIPVHLFGRVADMPAIIDLARRADVLVVEDAAQAHGARRAGTRAGAFGTAGAFSFYPSKNLGALGDGGMLVTNSEEVAHSVQAMRNYGQLTKNHHVMTPFNRRLDTIQAAVLLAKLPYLDAWNQRRARIADDYRDRLDGLPLSVPPPEPPGSHVYHLFVIRTADRDGLRHSLATAGIQTGIHYPTPVHLQPAFKHLGYREGQFPNAERLAKTSLSLPMYPELTPASVGRVAGEIRHHFLS